jgi:hypothetical protein
MAQLYSFVRIALVSVATIATLPGLLKPAIAQTDFPITEIRWSKNHPEEPWQWIGLTVPDQDTTIPVGRGELRLYDVHIAKMFEVTHYLCQHEHRPDQFEHFKKVWFSNYSSVGEKLQYLKTFSENRLNEKGFNWGYGAANDNIDMGQFDISCQLASEIAATYGLDNSKSTTVRTVRMTVTGGSYSKNYAIPTLNIGGTKTSKWMNFVQKFRPVRFYPPRKVDDPFPVDEILPKLVGKTEILILLPQRTNFRGQSFDISVNTNHYSIGIYAGTGFNPSSKSTASYHGDIGALYVGDNILHPKSAEPTEEMEKIPSYIFRKIQLAGGIQGTYTRVCGAYCTAYVVWQYEGVRYKVAGKHGSQQTLVTVANSMIEAGPR